MRAMGCLVVIGLAALVGPTPALAQEECENACAECPSDPYEWKNLGYGVSLWMTWLEPDEGCIGYYSCAPWEECRGPETEEENTEPREVLDARLDQLLALERSQVPGWADANRESFQLAVVDGTLQVATRCGAVITWVALEPDQVETTRALLATPSQ